MKKKLSSQPSVFSGFSNGKFNSFNAISNVLKTKFNIDFDKSHTDGGLSLLFKYLFDSQYELYIYGSKIINYLKNSENKSNDIDILILHNFQFSYPNITFRNYQQEHFKIQLSNCIFKILGVKKVRIYNMHNFLKVKYAEFDINIYIPNKHTYYFAGIGRICNENQMLKISKSKNDSYVIEDVRAKNFDTDPKKFDLSDIFDKCKKLDLIHFKKYILNLTNMNEIFNPHILSNTIDKFKTQFSNRIDNHCYQLDNKKIVELLIKNLVFYFGQSMRLLPYNVNPNHRIQNNIIEKVKIIIFHLINFNNQFQEGIQFDKEDGFNRVYEQYMFVNNAFNSESTIDTAVCCARIEHLSDISFQQFSWMQHVLLYKLKKQILISRDNLKLSSSSDLSSLSSGLTTGDGSSDSATEEIKPDNDVEFATELHYVDASEKINNVIEKFMIKKNVKDIVTKMVEKIIEDNNKTTLNPNLSKVGVETEVSKKEENHKKISLNSKLSNGNTKIEESPQVGGEDNKNIITKKKLSRNNKKSKLDLKKIEENITSIINDIQEVANLDDLLILEEKLLAIKTDQTNIKRALQKIKQKKEKINLYYCQKLFVFFQNPENSGKNAIMLKDLNNEDYSDNKSGLLKQFKHCDMPENENEFIEHINKVQNISSLEPDQKRFVQFIKDYYEKNFMNVFSNPIHITKKKLEDIGFNEFKNKWKVFKNDANESLEETKGVNDSETQLKVYTSEFKKILDYSNNQIKDYAIFFSTTTYAFKNAFFELLKQSLNEIEDQFKYEEIIKPNVSSIQSKFNINKLESYKGEILTLMHTFSNQRQQVNNKVVLILAAGMLFSCMHSEAHKVVQGQEGFFSQNNVFSPQFEEDLFKIMLDQTINSSIWIGILGFLFYYNAQRQVYDQSDVSLINQRIKEVRYDKKSKKDQKRVDLLNSMKSVLPTTLKENLIVIANELVKSEKIEKNIFDNPFLDS